MSGHVSSIHSRERGVRAARSGRVCALRTWRLNLEVMFPHFSEAVQTQFRQVGRLVEINLPAKVVRAVS